MSNDHSGIIKFNEVLSETLPYYVEICSSVGEPAFGQAKLIQEAFMMCFSIMDMSHKYAKPSPSEMSKLLQPISFKIYEIAVSKSLNVNLLISGYYKPQSVALALSGSFNHIRFNEHSFVD